MINNHMVHKYTAQAGEQVVWWFKAGEKIIFIFQNIRPLICDSHFPYTCSWKTDRMGFTSGKESGNIVDFFMKILQSNTPC